MGWFGARGCKDLRRAGAIIPGIDRSTLTVEVTKRQELFVALEAFKEGQTPGSYRWTGTSLRCLLWLRFRSKDYNVLGYPIDVCWTLTNEGFAPCLVNGRSTTCVNVVCVFFEDQMAKI